jgi:hypothetical protein
MWQEVRLLCLWGHRVGGLSAQSSINSMRQQTSLSPENNFGPKRGDSEQLAVLKGHGFQPCRKAPVLTYCAAVSRTLSSPTIPTRPMPGNVVCEFAR